MYDTLSYYYKIYKRVFTFTYLIIIFSLPKLLMREIFRQCFYTEMILGSIRFVMFINIIYTHRVYMRYLKIKCRNFLQNLVFDQILIVYVRINWYSLTSVPREVCNFAEINHHHAQTFGWTEYDMNFYLFVRQYFNDSFVYFSSLVKC